MTHRILLVEDDASLGRQIVKSMEEAGFEPTWLTDGDAAMRESPRAFALIVLDLMLPGAYGLDILKHIRAAGNSVPVLILSARNETRDKVRALELGADDFVTKPFFPEELIARIRARIRRPSLEAGGLVRAGGLEVDLAARSVKVDGETVELTRVEFDLLAALARRPGAAVARSWLADNVLDPDREGTERTLDVHVSRLRRKLGASGKCVATVWGVGYRLAEASE
ncbi:MAG: response regulator transcription factor [Planctomycetes bacterium]|nr:response regulator transcription factor [Planctomycetota bacterium]